MLTWDLPGQPDQVQPAFSSYMTDHISWSERLTCEQNGTNLVVEGSPMEPHKVNSAFLCLEPKGEVIIDFGKTVASLLSMTVKVSRRARPIVRA